MCADPDSSHRAPGSCGVHSVGREQPLQVPELDMIWCRPIAKLISRLLPTLAVAAVNKNTLYPEVQRQFDEDPLNFRGNVRARAAAGGAYRMSRSRGLSSCSQRRPM